MATIVIMSAIYNEESNVLILATSIKNFTLGSPKLPITSCD